MKKYGVLIVNESAVMRRHLSALIAQSEELAVIGKARNGIDMNEKIARFVPAFIVITYTIFEQQEARIVLEATNIPFIIIYDYYMPPQIEVDESRLLTKELVMSNEANELLVHWAHLAAQPRAPFEEPMPPIDPPLLMDIHTGQPSQKQLLIIGSSTGGPSALQHILTEFEPTINVPIVVIQHMPIGFTTSLARRLHSACQLPVKEAEHDEVLKRGSVYIAPAGQQTLLHYNEHGNYVIQLETNERQQAMYKPSIDVTLLSLAAPLYMETVMVMLTGMGNDGLQGCKQLKQHGGVLLAEAEETCVVYGMPRVVTEAGLVNKQVPLHNMFDEIMYYLQQ